MRITDEKVSLLSRELREVPLGRQALKTRGSVCCGRIITAMPGGRPRKYKTVEDMQRIIDAYFAECDPHIERLPTAERYKTKAGVWRERFVMVNRMTEQKPYTMAGLARRLGMSRQALCDYKSRDKFLDAIKEARGRIEEYNEASLHSGRAVTGAIFNLKVNFAYHENNEDNLPPENPVKFVNNIPIEGQ